MTNVVSAGDVAFACVRARWLVDSPRQVAEDLLAAADRPDLRDGVSASRARAAAVSVLSDFGDLSDAIGILRSAVAQSQPGSDELARFGLASMLAQAGETAEAEAIAHESIAAEAKGKGAGKAAVLPLHFEMARSFARAGLGDQAMWWADEGVAVASSVPGTLGVRLEQLAMGWRENVCDRLQEVQEFGPDHRRIASFPDPPWPTVTAGRLLWWPEAHYGRLIRQVPVLGDVLGQPWPDHTRLVESVLRDSTRWSPGAPASQTVHLVAGDFDNFTVFLGAQDADPRDPVSLTAYGMQESETPVVTWPPKPRQRCWCGSGRRYRDCCGAETVQTRAS